jgi:hypothetical protein
MPFVHLTGSNMNDFTAKGGNNGPVKPGRSSKAFKGDIGYSVRLEIAQTRD